VIQAVRQLPSVNRALVGVWSAQCSHEDMWLPDLVGCCLIIGVPVRSPTAFETNQRLENWLEWWRTAATALIPSGKIKFSGLFQQASATANDSRADCQEDRTRSPNRYFDVLLQRGTHLKGVRRDLLSDRNRHSNYFIRVAPNHPTKFVSAGRRCLWVISPGSGQDAGARGNDRCGVHSMEHHEQRIVSPGWQSLRRSPAKAVTRMPPLPAPSPASIP